jgi:hypothetical protein
MFYTNDPVGKFAYFINQICSISEDEIRKILSDCVCEAINPDPFRTKENKNIMIYPTSREAKFMLLDTTIDKLIRDFKKVKPHVNRIREYVLKVATETGYKLSERHLAELTKRINQNWTGINLSRSEPIHTNPSSDSNRLLLQQVPKIPKRRIDPNARSSFVDERRNR